MSKARRPCTRQTVTENCNKPSSSDGPTCCPGVKAFAMYGARAFRYSQKPLERSGLLKRIYAPEALGSAPKPASPSLAISQRPHQQLRIVGDNRIHTHFSSS